MSLVLRYRGYSNSPERMRRPPTPEGRTLYEGFLIRKHEWETTTKKATYRSWGKIYVVLKGRYVIFYKDQKHYKEDPENVYRGEAPINVSGSIVEVASYYTKRKYVFRLKIISGAEYLFQAKDEDEMNEWIDQLIVASRERLSGRTQSHTHLAPEGEERFFELRRRSFC